MKQATVISMVSAKGGIGKTTTCSTLGSALSLRNYKVLYIDNDAQSNLSLGMTITEVVEKNTMDLLMERCAAQDAIVKTTQGDLIAGGKELSESDVKLADIGKEYKLSEAIESVKSNYDFILIDCPPSLGTLTINAMTASDYIILPAQADAFSLQGIEQAFNTFQLVKKYTNRNLEILGIILTRYNGRTILTKELNEVMEDTAKKMGCSVLGHIREGIAVREAQAAKTDLLSYAPNSNPAQDYLNLTNTILKVINGDK